MKKNVLTLFTSLMLLLIIIELFFKFFLPQELSSPFRVNGKYGLILNIKNNYAKHYFENRFALYKFGQYHNRIYDFNIKEKKILILGDSFTFGWLLNDKDTFIYQLNDEFNYYNFINASAGGWGTSDQLRYLIDFCKSIKPEFVMVFINLDDIRRSQNSNLFSLSSEKKLIHGHNKVLKMTQITENFIYKFLVENFHIINFLKKKYAEIYLNSKTLENKIKENKENLNTNTINKKNISVDEYSLIKKLYLKMNEESKKCGANLILINLAWENYENFEELFFFKDNKNFFKENSITFIDLNNDMKIIQNNKSNYIIKKDYHPNEAANKLLFKFIKKRIKNLIN